MSLDATIGSSVHIDASPDEIWRCLSRPTDTTMRSLQRNKAAVGPPRQTYTQRHPLQSISKYVSSEMSHSEIIAFALAFPETHTHTHTHIHALSLSLSRTHTRTHAHTHIHRGRPDTDRARIARPRQVALKVSRGTNSTLLQRRALDFWTSMTFESQILDVNVDCWTSPQAQPSAHPARALDLPHLVQGTTR